MGFQVEALTSRSILLRIRTVSDKSYRENQNTHFVFNNFFSFENRAFYEIIWKKHRTVGQATDDKMAHLRCMLDN